MNTDRFVEWLRIGAWWTLLLACFGGTALGFLLRPTVSLDSSFAITFMVYGATGALIAHRRPGNPIGWVFLLAGALAGLAGFAESLTMDITAPAKDLTPLQVWGIWFNAWFWYLLLLLVTTFTVLLFPEGLPSRRWRPVLWAAIVSTGGIVIAAMFAPSLPLPAAEGSIDNPVSPLTSGQFGEDLEKSAFFTLLTGSALLIGLVGVVSVVLRYRRSTGDLRAQMKWFTWAVSILAGWILVGIVLEVFGLVGIDWVDRLTTFGLSIAMALIPIASGIAITRHSLFEIDRVISRTLAYTVVTIVVIATYALLITTITRLLPTRDTLVVAFATLTAAALFRPLLRTVRDIVDRRFNRSRYDAITTIDAFADTLRSTVDTETVQSQLSSAITQTLEPQTYRVWVRH